MQLTVSQLQTLKTDLNANFSGVPDEEAAAAYNLNASPDFWVWKTSLSERECVEQPSPDSTTFSWPQYIARTEAERSGWNRLFSSGVVNPALPNVRQAVADIFSGAQAAPTAQRAHLLAIARRLATRGEKLFSTGTGSTASPATMGSEGPITSQNVSEARNS